VAVSGSGISGRKVVSFFSSPLTPVDVDGDGLLNGIDFWPAAITSWPHLTSTLTRVSLNAFQSAKEFARNDGGVLQSIKSSQSGSGPTIKNLAIPLGTPNRAAGTRRSTGLRFEF